MKYNTTKGFGGRINKDNESYVRLKVVLVGQQKPRFDHRGFLFSLI